ncbi:hypothetical protein M427DRAFT_135213 [Gonapodya prolifera JEL478]|uniref:Chromo domain-containing protein n=1 Tax=Gonapodya prolifera (strain JEL478) TaxID=1344416 RepID=A0A139AEZ0_GONPJ|nr:hypothetical protein M427DRAFT_135213 [Gonapodya prolifera JEL478]|eukprot:KXS15249.1 hypothetical protein M427DRAFT_135213 [Gonapodya prolifera JEL478]
MKSCYLIMWKGYPREFDTWEVAANLQADHKLINKFEAVWTSLKVHPPYGVLEEKVRLEDGDVSDDEVTVLSSDDSGDDMSVGSDRTAQDPEANRKSHSRKSKGKEKPPRKHTLPPLAC